MKPGFSSHRLIAALAIVPVLYTQPALHAAALTWDSNTGTTGAQDGLGTWTTAAGGWWNGTSNVNWAAADTATFGAGTDAGSKAITLGGAITTGSGTSSAGGIHFANSGYTLSAAAATTITLGAADSFLTVASGKSGTIGANVTIAPATTRVLSISGGGTLFIQNGGTVRNPAANNNLLNIIGGTTVNVGTGGSLLSTNNQIVIGTSSSGTLVVDGGTVSGGAASSNIVLANSSSGTVSGELTVNSGSVTFASTSGGLRIGSTGAGTGTSNGTVNINGGTLEIARIYEGGGSGITQNSTVNFDGGTLKVRTGSTNAANYIIVDNAYIKEGGAIIHTNGVTTAIAQVFQHGSVAATDGGIRKQGTGSLTLSGNNSHTGDTVQESTGALILAHANALGTGKLQLKSTQSSTGETLRITGGISVANQIVMDSTTGRENIFSTGTGDNAFTGGITITGAGNNALVIANNQTSGNLTISGGVNGASYLGSISLRGTLAGAKGFLNGAVTLASDLQNNGTTDWTINAVGSSYNSTRFANTGNIILGANNGLATNGQVYWGGTAPATWGKLDMAGFNASVAGLNGTGATLSGTYGSVINTGGSDSVLTLANLLADLNFAGPITDGTTNKTSLTLNSAGRIQTLSGTSTYTGNTIISAGTLLVTGALGATNVTVNGGAFGGTGTVGGALTVAGGSLQVADLSNPLDVTGTVTIYSGFGIDDLAGLDWGSVANGTYTLINGTLGTGVFAALANNSLAAAYDLGGGRSAYFEQGSLDLIVIPEPRAALLGGLGLLALLRRRRFIPNIYR